MSRRYNFTQCVTLLHTNFKTFKHWLVEDGIDAGKQLNRADSREKYLTEEQLVAMARKREIPLQLPDPERKTESTSARILAAMDGRFAELEQQIAHRFDQVEAQLHTFMADVRRDLEQPEPQPTQRFDQLDARLEQLLAELQRARASAPPQARPHPPAPRARNAAPPKPTAKKSAANEQQKRSSCQKTSFRSQSSRTTITSQRKPSNTPWSAGSSRQSVGNGSTMAEMF